MADLKVLTADGVKVLYDLLSLQDYPNNDILMAVINAIDETKMDKSSVFVGTRAEYNIAYAAGNVPVGAVVILTDVD